MSAAPIATTLLTDDRAFWKRYSQSPVELKIGTILLNLGLKQANPGPGRPIFQSDRVTQLANAVADAITRLPTTREQLLDVASDPSSLRLPEEVALIQLRFGDRIWGAGEKRTWLLQASEGKAEYAKDLYFGNRADEKVLNDYLRLWILAKAFNSLRNRVARAPVARSSMLSLPARNIQVDARGHPFPATAAANLAVVSSVAHLPPIAPTERADPPLNESSQVRRTTRTPKPRQLQNPIDYSSDASLEEHLNGDLDSDADIPKYYKGKGRPWKKVGVDEDPAFQVATNARTSKLPADAHRPRGRPKGRRSTHVLFEEFVRDDTTDDDTIVLPERDEGQSRRSRQTPRKPPAHTSVSTQEFGASKQQEASKPVQKRRPRKKYLSEKVIRNSSDETEEDNILTETVTTKNIEWIVGTEVHHSTSQPEVRHSGKYSPRSKDAYLDSQRSLRPLRSPAKTKPPRQPPGSCESCSRRHSKCDRVHPSCSVCARLGCACIYPKSLTTVPDSTPTASPRKEQGSSFVKSTTEDVSSERTVQEGVETGFTMPLAKRNLRLDQYWDKEAWRTFYLRENERQIFLATVRSLGLKVKPRQRMRFEFEIENFINLGRNVNRVAKTLSGKFSAAQLIRDAANSEYLDDHIDTLFDIHSSIWSIDADRTKLLTAGAKKEYPKDLFYEESDDQKVLWIHLHRWIFIVALRLCKERFGPKVNDMDKVPQWEDGEVPEDMLGGFQLEGYVFREPEATPIPSPSTDSETSSSAINKLWPSQRGRLDNSELTSPASPDSEPSLEEYESDLLHALGHFFAEQNEQRNKRLNKPVGTRDQATPEPESIIKKQLTKRRRKRKDSTTGIEQQEAFRPLKQRRRDQHRTTSKGHNFTALFMSYLEMYHDPKFDELTALKNLAHELSILQDHAADFPAQKGIEFATAFFVVCFPAWLLCRQEIVNVKRSFAAMQPLEQAQSRQVALQERSRLATHLRQVHETFMRAGHAGTRPEQVILKAMVMLMNEHGHSWTAENVRRGFKGMENELKRLADQLMSGGARFVLGDHTSVVLLRNLRPHAWVSQDARRQAKGQAGFGGLYA